MKLKTFIPFAMALLLAPALLAQDYAIKFNREKKPGQEYNLAVTYKLSRDLTVTSNGNPVKSEKVNITGQCEGVLKIVEVDGIGVETKTTLTISKFTKNEGGTESEVMAKGDVLTSSVEGKKIVHVVNGKPVTPDVAQLLHTILHLSKGGKGDDAIFGTTERKKKGDSWDMNGEVAMQDFSSSSDGGKFENLTGKVTLDDVVGDSLKVSSHIKGNLLPPLPPAFTITTSSFEGTFGALLPIDPAKMSADESLNLAISFQASGDGSSGNKVEINFTMTTSALRNLTLVK